MAAVKAARVTGLIGGRGPGSQLINKEVGKVWVIGWTYDLGRLPSGTYSGTGTWASTVPAISLLWSEDEPDQRTPTHWSMGVWDCTYTFTVE
jgi:hypothetical protein